MNAHTDDYGRITDESPEAGELWMLHVPSDSFEHRVFAAVECTGVTDDDPDWVNPDEIGTLYSVDVHWTTDAEFPSEWLDDHDERIDESHFALRLPEDPSHFDDDYRDGLDHVTGHLTPQEVMHVLAGESYQADKRPGYEGIRLWILEGVRESITEFSVGHGHGPSRYARAVESRLDLIPESFWDDFLYSEMQRWDGAMIPVDDHLAKTVEILMLREEYLDEDNTEEITELVTEYDLEYDEYREVDR